MRVSKYDPLYEFLKACREDKVLLSFEEIEEILGFSLTASAETPVWWANATSTKTRAQTPAWLDAGYDATFRHGYVTFQRMRRPT